MEVKKQELNKKLGAVLFLVFLGIFSFQTSLAADEIDNQPATVQVSPVRFDWDLKTGEEKNAQINLKNYAKKPYKVKVQIEDFYVSDDSSVAEFFVPDADHPFKAYDVINWVSTSETNVVLAPGESKYITFSVKVPKDTPTGGYYGVVFFQYEEKMDNASEDGEAAKIKINTRSGTLLTFAVQGKEPMVEKGFLDKFTTLKKFHWDAPVTFLSEISNSGNIHYKMAGNIAIERFGNKQADVKVDTRLYYPKKIRPLENKWEFGFFDVGYYTAKMNLSSEDGMVSIFGKTSFFVVPWKLLVTVIGIIFVFWVIFKLGGKRERRRISHRTVK